MTKIKDASNKLLDIGYKNGCMTVIAGFEAYQEEQAKDNFSGNINNSKRYKVRCKCGKEHFWTAERILRKKWRDCSEDCDLKLQREARLIASYPRVESQSYNMTFVNNIHESLTILECVNDHVEGEPIVQDKRKKGAGEVLVYKKFRCKCSLCGQEYVFRSDDFIIRNDRYGSRAHRGYYCDACCDCHSISSFQWRTIAIFVDRRTPYQVEVSFPDLLSEKGNPLRYDFAILNLDGSIKCLIECQGKQHFEIGNGFGGYASLEIRQQHDKMKRDYAQSHNIPLIEIPYTYNTFEKEVEYLKAYDVI